MKGFRMRYQLRAHLQQKPILCDKIISNNQST